MNKELVINNKKYILRLTCRSTILLEKKIKTNPLLLFVKMENGTMLTMEEMLQVLYYSLLANHKDITFEQTCDLFDQYIEEGNTIEDLLALLVEVVSTGYVKKEENNGKN